MRQSPQKSGKIPPKLNTAQDTDLKETLQIMRLSFIYRLSLSRKVPFANQSRNFILLKFIQSLDNFFFFTLKKDNNQR